MVRSDHSSSAVPAIVHSVQVESLTYLEESALEDLFQEVKAIENANSKGILIEAGCALGGSAIVMAAAKSTQRPLYVYDVFRMIPSPTQEDGADVHERYDVIKSGQSEGIGGNRYYGYEENLFERVVESFARHGVPVEMNNVHLVKGLFAETLWVTEPVSLAHIDGDWYASVMTRLQRIEPYLVQHGVLVIDDYDCWSGCRKAVDEYFKEKKEKYEFIRKSRLHIIPR